MSKILCTLETLGKNLQKEAANELKQIKYAASNALNKIAFVSQRKLKEEYTKNFKVRNKTLPRKIEVTKATKQNLEAKIALNAPNTGFMEIHTTGGISKPTKSKHLAVPGESIQEKGRTGTGKMKQSLRPAQLLKYANMHPKKRRNKVANPHAFLVNKNGKILIGRRLKDNRKKTEWLYLQILQAKEEKRWAFKEIVKSIADLNLAKEFEQQLKRALETKK